MWKKHVIMLGISIEDAGEHGLWVEMDEPSEVLYN